MRVVFFLLSPLFAATRCRTLLDVLAVNASSCLQFVALGSFSGVLLYCSALFFFLGLMVLFYITSSSSSWPWSVSLGGSVFELRRSFLSFVDWYRICCFCIAFVFMVFSY